MVTSTTSGVATASASSTMQRQQQKRHHTARSISECVDIDYVDEDVSPHNDDDNDNNQDDADDDDDDDGDFTTLSEMTESSKHISSHTVAPLLGNIDFTTKTSSSVINETISGHVNGRGGGIAGLELKFQGGDSQNLLANLSSDDEKSIQLCHADNESVNSIEFKADISRGLVVEGVHSGSTVDDVFPAVTSDAGTPRSTAATTTPVTAGGSSDGGAFTTFFNNINAGK